MPVVQLVNQSAEESTGRRAPAVVIAPVFEAGAACRSLAVADNGRHSLRAAALKLRLFGLVTLRAGLGIAQMRRAASLVVEDRGTALAAGVGVALWAEHGFTVSLELNSMHASYDERTLTDTTMLVALRSR